MRGFLFRRGFILPVVVAGVAPIAIVLATSAWRTLAPLWLVPGALLAFGGLTMLALTTTLFAQHHGSLAPWNPPTELVLVGPYQHCRNPMISGVYAMLVGEAIAFHSWPVLLWGVAFIVGMSTQIVLHEEPILRERFGAPYDDYCRHVPRWVPRLRPFTAEK
jgi:protein-S-isoprenylcysteine O-methyltransferase Ste14